MKLHGIVFGLLLALSLSACSLTKDTSDMKKTTQEMKTSTEQMNDNTRHIDQSSTDLADNTRFLRNDLTAKESYVVVNSNLDSLFAHDTTTGLDLGTTPDPTMLDFGKATIMSMLFQYWKGVYNETNLSSLDSRFALHIQLLFGRCLAHIPSDYKVDIKFLGVMPSHPDGFYRAIASLAAFLDEETDEYAQVLQEHGLKSLSLYDVMVQALKNRTRMERTEMLPKATQAVLQFQREAIYMLQLRHNYLPVMVLGRMTPFKDFSDLQRMAAALTGAGLSVDLGLTQPMAPASVNVEQLREWTGWLNKALQTRADLKAMGIPPEYNSAFMDVVGKLNFGQAQILALSPSQLTPLQKQVRELALALNKVIHP